MRIFKTIYVYLEVGYTNFLRLLKIRKSIKPIPKNTLYCYEFDTERNKKEPIDGYWIKPCKYHRYLDKGNSGCTYVGFVGFDVCLSDKCKICNIE